MCQFATTTRAPDATDSFPRGWTTTGLPSPGCWYLETKPALAERGTFVPVSLSRAGKKPVYRLFPGCALPVTVGVGPFAGEAVPPADIKEAQPAPLHQASPLLPGLPIQAGRGCSGERFPYSSRITRMPAHPRATISRSQRGISDCPTGKVSERIGRVRAEGGFEEEDRVIPGRDPSREGDKDPASDRNPPDEGVVPVHLGAQADSFPR